jgi:peptidoglycan/xylan/chitin deacetylase (PgdA/CDA1 family)
MSPVARLAVMLYVTAMVAAGCGSQARPATAPSPAAPVLSLSPAAPPQPPAVRHAPAHAVRTEAQRGAPSPRPATSRPIPVLMYHVIDVPPRGAPFPGLYVAPAVFAAQMAALRAAGYQAVTLDQAWAIWQGRATGPARPVVLSFDNGYASVFERAVPLLASYGWPGVLNLVVGRLNAPGGLSTAQVRHMIALGWEVDDDTLTHPDLSRLSPAGFRAQVLGAAQIIRADFGVPVHFVCWPSGEYNPAAVALLRQEGFLGATTTWPGDANPATEGAWTLDRVRVSWGESAPALLAALRRYAAQPPALPPPVFRLSKIGAPPAARPAGRVVADVRTG